MFCFVWGSRQGGGINVTILLHFFFFFVRSFFHSARAFSADTIIAVIAPYYSNIISSWLLALFHPRHKVAV